MKLAVAELSLTELARLIRRKEISSVEVATACLDRIEAWQPRINCFIAVEAEDALKAARSLDRDIVKRGPRGPLHGVPVAHKDVFYRKGRICSAGSKILRDWVAPYSSTAVARLQAAGAVCLGRLNTSEFAADATGHNKHFGTCRNPWNPAHITGGSSSGSGAAVAARLVFGSLGTCTGGSVRVPAAANGVVGLTPTYGRVSRHGVVPRAWSLDHVGPLTPTVLDCARMTRVVAGHDPNDGTSGKESVPNYEAAAKRGIRGLKIGIPANHFYDDVTPDVGRALDLSVEALKFLGARVVRVKVPDPAPFHRISDLIQKCESAVIHGQWLRERRQDYAEYVRARIEAGLFIPATRYIEALILRGTALAEFLATVMDKVDVLHCPVIPFPVPTTDELNPVGADPTILEKTIRLPALTRIFNFLGVPSLNVPCGFAANGLPVSFQVVARPFDEAALFQVGHAYQGVTDWHRRVPPLRSGPATAAGAPSAGGRLTRLRGTS